MSKTFKCDICRTATGEGNLYGSPPDGWRTLRITIGSANRSGDICPGCLEKLGLTDLTQYTSAEVLFDAVRSIIAEEIETALSEAGVG